MRLTATTFCQLFGAMQIYASKTTRESKPAPEIRWATGENVCIIGFDDFSYPVRFSIAHLNGEDGNLLGDDSTGIYTEVPSVGYFGDIVKDTAITIDTDSSRNQLVAYTNSLIYKVNKIRHADTLDFRRRCLPLEPIAQGRIERKKLFQCIDLSPDETLQLVLADGSVTFVSESTAERVEFTSTDVEAMPAELTPRTYLLDITMLSEAVKNIPKDKQLQFSITEEFLRLRYRLSEIGYVDYYQRIKNGGNIICI